MAEDISVKIRAAIAEDREAQLTKVKDAIRIYVNVGLVAFLVVVFIGSGAMRALETMPGIFTTGESLIIIMLVGFAVIMTVVAWDIISGISIIEQKLKVLCREKE